jgi:hypothetical protein
MKPKLFKDTIHGFTAKSIGKNGAWVLIRAKCKQMGLEVPTFDKIVEVPTHSEIPNNSPLP